MARAKKTAAPVPVEGTYAASQVPYHDPETGERITRAQYVQLTTAAKKAATSEAWAKATEGGSLNVPGTEENGQ